MDSAKPHSLGSLATRMACTLIGLLLLYVLSYGPAVFIWRIYPDTYLTGVKLYSPCLTALGYTWPARVWSSYGDCWWDLASSFAPKENPQIPPATP